MRVREKEPKRGRERTKEREGKDQKKMRKMLVCYLFLLLFDI